MTWNVSAPAALHQISQRFQSANVRKLYYISRAEQLIKPAIGGYLRIYSNIFVSNVHIRVQYGENKMDEKILQVETENE